MLEISKSFTATYLLGLMIFSRRVGRSHHRISVNECNQISDKNCELEDYIELKSNLKRDEQK